MPHRLALALPLLLVLGACAGTVRVDGLNPGAVADVRARDYVLDSRGGYVGAEAPPGVEVRLGSKAVRPVAARDGALAGDGTAHRPANPWSSSANPN